MAEGQTRSAHFRLQDLPVELALRVITLAASSSTPDALNLCLTSKQVREWSIPSIYHAINIASGLFRGLLQTLDNNPRLCDHINSLCVVNMREPEVEGLSDLIFKCHALSVLAVSYSDQGDTRPPPVRVALAPRQVFVVYKQGSNSPITSFLNCAPVRAALLSGRRALMTNTFTDLATNQQGCLELMIIHAHKPRILTDFYNIEIPNRVRLVFITQCYHIREMLSSSGPLSERANVEVFYIGDDHSKGRLALEVTNGKCDVFGEPIRLTVNLFADYLLQSLQFVHLLLMEGTNEGGTPRPVIAKGECGDKRLPDERCLTTKFALLADSTPNEQITRLAANWSTG